MQVVLLLLMCWVWYHRAANAVSQSSIEQICSGTREKTTLAGQDATLMCRVPLGVIISSVTWFLQRYNQEHSEPLEGLSPVPPVLDLLIQNVSSDSEGKYSCRWSYTPPRQSTKEERADVLCLFVRARAVLRCAGSTRNGNQVTEPEITEHCHRSLIAAEGDNVSLDSSVLFVGGGNRSRQAVLSVSVHRSGDPTDLYRCNATAEGCTGNRDVQVLIQQNHSAAMDIRLILQNVAQGGGMYTVTVEVAIAENPMEIDQHRLQYDLTVHELVMVTTTEAISPSTTTTTTTTTDLVTTGVVTSTTDAVLSPADEAASTVAPNHGVVSLLGGAVGGVLFILVVVVVSGGVVVVIRWRSPYHKKMPRDKALASNDTSNGVTFAPAVCVISGFEDIVESSSCYPCDCGGSGHLEDRLCGGIITENGYPTTEAHLCSTDELDRTSNLDAQHLTLGPDYLSSVPSDV